MGAGRPNGRTEGIEEVELGLVDGSDDDERDEDARMQDAGRYRDVENPSIDGVTGW
jgi:hypothetical protein